MKILNKDDRDNCPSEFAENGVYYVYKKNIISQFSFGKNASFANVSEAFDAMKKFMGTRKDADNLVVSLLQRGTR